MPKGKLQKTIKAEVERQRNAIITTAKESTIAEIKEQSRLEKVMQTNEAMRYRIPFGFNQWTNSDRKIGSDLPFSFMRRMATLYPIARACINRRTRQINQLDWEITTIDEIEGEGGYTDQIKAAKEFFKEPTPGLKLREFLSALLDDILTVDAVALEYQRDRAGRLLNLVPVDPTTIVLRVTEQGATPQPPDIAYAQYIRGEKIAEFTSEDLFYGMMNKKTHSPYGLAPLESLILQAESALRGTMYNLNYFRESNVPEGFITLPEEVATTPDTIKEWQTWFDNILSGDPRFMHRLKILPGGATYTPAKKPEDMAFERFEMWLLQQTCAVFDVPPQDIGITYQVNKATAQVQQDTGRESGLYPLANFVRDIFNDWLQKELGFTNLQFVWQNLNPVDRLEEVDIARKEIEMGALSVDEYRLEHGYNAIGLPHYVKTGTGITLVRDLITGADTQTPKATDPTGGAETNDELDVTTDPAGDNPDAGQQPATPTKAREVDHTELEQKDIKRWKKCVYSDLEKGREVRVNFKSDFISEDTYALIKEGLTGVKNKMQAKLFFDSFLDPEIRASYKLLKMASEMRRFEDAEYLAS